MDFRDFPPLFEDLWQGLAIINDFVEIYQTTIRRGGLVGLT
jgi:hypothetical protein